MENGFDRETELQDRNVDEQAVLVALRCTRDTPQATPCTEVSNKNCYGPVFICFTVNVLETYGCTRSGLNSVEVPEAFCFAKPPLPGTDASPCNLTPLDTPMSNAMLEHPIATAAALVRA
eukprot:551375-Amphidinium_carterae.1